MPRALLSALLVLLALPATSAAADRCAPRPGERALARSAQAVVLQRERTISYDDAPYRSVQTLVGCARRTGRRRVVTRLEYYDLSGGQELGGLKLSGSRIAYIWRQSAREVIGTHLVADDAIHDRRHRDLSDAQLWPYPRDADIASFAVAPDGTVAWVARRADDQLLVWHDDGLRRHDVGFDLSGPLAVGDGTVRWRHGDRRRSAPLALPPTRCSGRPAREGTPEVDLTSSHTALTACRRATGGSLTVDGDFTSSFPAVDVAGPYVALNGQNALRRLDLPTGSVDTIAARGQTFVRVDEAGSLAWYELAAPLLAQLWVRDAGGVRAIGDLSPRYGLLGRDGPTVRHGDTVFTLDP
jgi:hypothetical protein